MNKEDPYRQKTDDTRQRIQRAQTEEKATSKELPPRSEIHQKQRKKAKPEKQISYPIIRLLGLFFILLPITIFAVYSYRDVIFPSEKKQTAADKTGYETISIENKDPRKKEKDSETEKSASGNVEGSDDTADIDKDATAQQTQTADEEASADATEENKNSPQESIEAAGTVMGTSGTAGGDSSVENPPGNKSVVVKEHTVQTGETLYRITIKYYQSKNGIEIIKKANQLSSNEITVGQVLKIPIEN